MHLSTELLMSCSHVTVTKNFHAVQRATGLHFTGGWVCKTNSLEKVHAVDPFDFDANALPRMRYQLQRNQQ